MNVNAKQFGKALVLGYADYNAIDGACDQLDDFVASVVNALANAIDNRMLDTNETHELIESICEFARYNIDSAPGEAKYKQRAAAITDKLRNRD